MALTLTNRTRPFRYLGDSPLISVSIEIVRSPIGVRILSSQGIADVVNGYLFGPISAKYQGFGLIRFVNEVGHVVNEERRLEFKHNDYYPDDDRIYGFEVYIKQGSVINVVIESLSMTIDLTNYYTKTEVDGLLSGKASAIDVYIKSEIDNALALRALQSNTYTKSEVLALISSGGNGFTYDQQTVPSAPTAGQTWRERGSDGQIKNDWEWNGTINRWQSLQEYTSSVKRYMSGGYGDQEFPDAIYSPTYDVRVTRATWASKQFDNHSNSSYWTMIIKSGVDGSTLATLTQTKTFLAYVVNEGQTQINQTLGSGLEYAYNLRGDNTNFAGDIDFYCTMFYRFLR